MDALRDAQHLLEMASATDAPYAKELRNVARRILLDVAETLGPVMPPHLLSPHLLSPAVPQTPPAAQASSVPPPAPPRVPRPLEATHVLRGWCIESPLPSPIERVRDITGPIGVDEVLKKFEEVRRAEAPPASVLTSATTARNRKNFAKFVRALNLPNDTAFFYGSVKFYLSGAGTTAPSLTFVHNGTRISSPAPSGIISQYEKVVNGRTVTVNGWDRLKMLDSEDKPRSLSWEGWDLVSEAAEEVEAQ